MGGSSNPSYVSKKFSKFAKALAYLCVFAISVGSIACQGFRINEVSYGEYENSAIKQIELGANVYYIGDCAFSCSQLESITMPSVEIIGSNAFSGCQNLTNITFSEDLQEIGSYAFNGCTKLTSIRLPAGSDFIINHSAFSSCESLTEVVFVEEFETANGVFQIGAKAFDQCRSLKEIQLPRNLERINEGLFYSCTSLEKVYFRRNSQLSGIYHNAFYGCSSLKEIVIPSKVNDVDSSAFSSCGKLQKIYFEGVEEDFNDIKGDLYSDSNKPQVQDATVYYYSQTEPTEAGNFWHYVNDVPTIWA